MERNTYYKKSALEKQEIDSVTVHPSLRIVFSIVPNFYPFTMYLFTILFYMFDFQIIALP